MFGGLAQIGSVVLSLTVGGNTFSSCQTHYEDKDGDGYCVTVVDQPVGLNEIEECQPIPDCDDTNAAINPGATEICNGVDDNCDGEIDEWWSKTYGGSSYDYAYAVQQTTDGGYVLSGTIYSETGRSASLIKTDAWGNMEWSQTYEGDGGYSVQQTTDGGFVLTGTMSTDVWLGKTDAWGNMEWSQTYGGSSEDLAYSVQQTTDGGYVLGGWTYSYGEVLPSFYLVKTDPLGNEEWNQIYGKITNSYDLAYSVQQTTDGGYVLAGYTYPYSSGGSAVDFWLVKTDSLGNKEWDQTYGGSGSDLAYSVQQTTDGGFALAGYTTSYGAGNYDFWLVKTDPLGNKEWDQTYGGSSVDGARFVRQATDGGYVLTGATYSYEAESVYDTNFWLVKTDPLGNKEWDQVFGSSGGFEDEAYSVQQTTDGGFVLVGYSYTGAGSSDFWLVKTCGPEEE